MVNQLEGLTQHVNNKQYYYWLHHDLFSSQWWLIVILSALFLFIFYLLIDRQRMVFILLVFFISFVLVGIVDELGKFFGVWSYPHQFLVFTHRFNSVDFAVIPVILTLVYQFFSKWKFYWVASLVASAFIAFIGVPIFTFFHLYDLNHWNTWKALITIYPIGLFIKVISDFIYSNQRM
ncbi:CBO0543 family protein [Priestia megaterium]|uniref:CBO0543 family protein n=1 Tax=Priestia megaterium TaxID=1404 RepID=UPI00209EF450|nr:CBO0543 family protein [Priestia megaterium]MCP1452395.1 hypothetical protein [Priestia megaterium]